MMSDGYTDEEADMQCQIDWQARQAKLIDGNAKLIDAIEAAIKRERCSCRFPRRCASNRWKRPAADLSGKRNYYLGSATTGSTSCISSYSCLGSTSSIQTPRNRRGHHRPRVQPGGHATAYELGCRRRHPHPPKHPGGQVPEKAPSRRQTVGLQGHPLRPPLVDTYVRP